MAEPIVNCSTCKFWVHINGYGFCHRYAPRPLAHERGDEWSYPMTPSENWCGDWVKKEKVV